MSTAKSTSSTSDDRLPKLIRDLIPDIIKQSGRNPVIKQLSPDEFQRYLELKLQEELDEYLESRDPTELADMLEVINTLARLQNLSPTDIEQLRQDKKTARGGFDQQILLEAVDTKV